VLDLLAARGVRATFFLIGRAARQHPEIVRRIVAEGHDVGNHTDEHSYMFWAFPPKRIEREITAAQQSIESVSGARCRSFRAPVGLKNWFLHPVLRRHGLELVSWQIRFLERDGLDRERTASLLRRRLRPGSILLLHDGHDRRPEGRPETLAALPVVLDTLQDAGYRCVRLG
jgi:peptidoglycan/xylan/chitin deacetylase (PgdA/CDA1 family)